MKVNEIRFEIETENEQIGNEIRHTTWLVHPNGHCRAVLKEWWTDIAKAEGNQ